MYLLVKSPYPYRLLFFLAHYARACETAMAILCIFFRVGEGLLPVFVQINLL